MHDPDSSGRAPDILDSAERLVELLLAKAIDGTDPHLAQVNPAVWAQAGQIAKAGQAPMSGTEARRYASDIALSEAAYAAALTPSEVEADAQRAAEAGDPPPLTDVEQILNSKTGEWEIAPGALIDRAIVFAPDDWDGESSLDAPALRELSEQQKTTMRAYRARRAVVRRRHATAPRVIASRAARPRAPHSKIRGAAQRADKLAGSSGDDEDPDPEAEPHHAASEPPSGRLSCVCGRCRTCLGRERQRRRRARLAPERDDFDGFATQVAAVLAGRLRPWRLAIRGEDVAFLTEQQREGLRDRGARQCRNHRVLFSAGGGCPDCIGDFNGAPRSALSLPMPAREHALRTRLDSHPRPRSGRVNISLLADQALWRDLAELPPLAAAQARAIYGDDYALDELEGRVAALRYAVETTIERGAGDAVLDRLDARRSALWRESEALREVVVA